MPMSSRTHKADVMISSTSKDLEEHREAVRDAVWRSRMYPLAMERGTAAPDADAIKFSLDIVDEAEAYIGIFVFRYGCVPKDAKRNPHHLSVTELEYRHAVERNLPIMIFIMGKNHAITPDAFETNADSLTKLNKLRTELEEKHIVAYFDSPEDLKAKVLQALYEWKIAGLIDTSANDDETDLKRIHSALPEPPQLYTYPPYILTNTFIGRATELGELDEWGKSTASMMVVEAIGGMGKSALTWQWMNQHAARTVRGFAGAIWWSFYEGGATVQSFIRHALAYITQQDRDALKELTYEERAARLLTELKRRPYLLVMDGFERVLVAYHRIDPSRLRDEEVQGDLRACTDPRDGDFMHRLVACAPSKILISTRLMPRDLEDGGDPIPGVVHKELEGLHPDDAVELMRDRGVKKADRHELERFMKQFGYHGLLLKILAGRIKNYRRAPGDFDAWEVNEGKNLHLAELSELKQRRSHILAYALEGLDEAKRRLLSQIAAFSDAVNYDALAVLNPWLPPKPGRVEKPREPFGLSLARMRLQSATTVEGREAARRALAEEETRYAQDLATYQEHEKALEAYTKSSEYRAALTELDRALTELEERGLLQWDRENDNYDLHPVVRAFAFDLLAQNDRAQTFNQIRGYFEGLPPENAEQAVEIIHLKNTIEIYRALVGAGLFDEASDFYGTRLRNVLENQIAAYHTIVELLSPLFPNGIDQLPALSSAAGQSNRMNDLSKTLYYLGRTEEALKVQGLKLKLDLERRNAPNLGVALRNYANSLANDNQLAAALQAVALGRDLAEAAEDHDGLAFSHLSSLVIYRDIGDWHKAEAAYQAFVQHPVTIRRTAWMADIERLYAESLIYRGEDATRSLDRATQLAQESRHTYLLLILYDLRGEFALQRNHPDEAAEYFQTAITMARKSGLSGWNALGGLARARILQKRDDDARKLIDNGVPDVDAAEVSLGLGDAERARHWAKTAYEWAWADGPPFVHRWTLERARKVLDAVNEPHPPLADYDETQIRQIPYEYEIRAYIKQINDEKADRFSDQ